MKTSITNCLIVVALTVIISRPVSAQLNVSTQVSPEYMVNYFMGFGVTCSNVIYTGADTARGIFSNGGQTNLGLTEGIVLTSGTISLVPGPNNSTSGGISNNMPGDPDLAAIVGTQTYDAAVLEFDFVPAADTVWCRYVFGSEEYPEWVLATFNDVFAYFVSGPDPAGGTYDNENIALIPGTNLPVSIFTINNIIPSYPQYYVDNSNGQTIQYDGFTTVLPAFLPVIPGESYHIKLAVCDASDGIYDTGILLEGGSFESQGPPLFQSFGFTGSCNPQLGGDYWGTVAGTDIYITLPQGTDVSDLVASFEMPGGVVAFVGDMQQVSCITHNDFSDPVTYLVDGNVDKAWTVHVDVAVSSPENAFPGLRILPSGDGSFTLLNAGDARVIVWDVLGSNRVLSSRASGGRLVLTGLEAGVYTIRIEEGGKVMVKKIVVAR